MRNILAFFQTKIGIAALAAIVIVGGAAGFKYKSTQNSSAHRATGLLVEKIISDSLKGGDQLDQIGYQPATSSDTVAPKSEPEVPYTATDKLSQEIFREYIAAKQSGGEITPDLSARIAESVLAKDYSDAKTLYTAADMKISGDTSISGLKIYANALGTILSTPPAAKVSEADIFAKITTESVEKYSTDLNALKKRYIGMRTKILALPVPGALALSQANIVNGIDVFIGSIDGALAIDSDPIGSLGKISRYQDGINLITPPLQVIKTYLKKQNVAFTSKEGGYVLTQ